MDNLGVSNGDFSSDVSDDDPTYRVATTHDQEENSSPSSSEDSNIDEEIPVPSPSLSSSSFPTRSRGAFTTRGRGRGHGRVRGRGRVRIRNGTPNSRRNEVNNIILDKWTATALDDTYTQIHEPVYLPIMDDHWNI